MKTPGSISNTTYFQLFWMKIRKRPILAGVSFMFSSRYVESRKSHAKMGLFPTCKLQLQHRLCVLFSQGSFLQKSPVYL